MHKRKTTKKKNKGGGEGEEEERGKGKESWANMNLKSPFTTLQLKSTLH